MPFDTEIETAKRLHAALLAHSDVLQTDGTESSSLGNIIIANFEFLQQSLAERIGPAVGMFLTNWRKGLLESAEAFDAVAEMYHCGAADDEITEHKKKILFAARDIADMRQWLTDHPNGGPRDACPIDIVGSDTIDFDGERLTITTAQMNVMKALIDNFPHALTEGQLVTKSGKDDARKHFEAIRGRRPFLANCLRGPNKVKGVGYKIVDTSPFLPAKRR